MRIKLQLFVPFILINDEYYFCLSSYTCYMSFVILNTDSNLYVDQVYVITFFCFLFFFLSWISYLYLHLKCRISRRLSVISDDRA